MPKPLAYVDGNFLPIEEAKVPLEDRGFLFADAVYEVIVAFKGKPFKLEEHIERLKRGAEEIEIPWIIDEKRVKDIVKEGIKLSGYDPCKIYMEYSRGAGPREHVPSKPLIPTFVLTFREHTPVPMSVIERGLRLLPYPDIRWKRCDIKTVMLIPNVLAKMKALKEGYDDALFVDDNGLVKECTSAGFGVIRGNNLIFPKKEINILPSITRNVVVEITKEIGLEPKEEDIYLEDLKNVDAAFVCSTLQDVTPVVKVADIQIGDGKPSPVVLKILEIYRKLLVGEE